MSRPVAGADHDDRRPRVFGALAAALPDRVTPRRDRDEAAELRVVEPAHRRRRRHWRVGTVAGLMLFVALFLVAGAQTLIVQQQGHLDDVNERIDAAEQEAARLQIEVTELRSPERIQHEAETKLGMVPAAEPVYLHPRLDDDARASESPPPTTSPPTKATTAPKAATKATTPTTAPSTGKATTIPSTGTSGSTGTGSGR
ncbi:MAG TPA: septum formation initiator family protein [Acidimicrobiales bacterium]